MPHVGNTVKCPLCGGECDEDYDCASDYTSYYCLSCGYCSNSLATMKELNKTLPKNLRPLVRWGDMEKSGGVVVGKLPWWPGGLEYMGVYTLHPAVAGGQLIWRRRDINEIPESERKNYPLEDGTGFYKYRAAQLHADYKNFSQARTATREEQLARAICQQKSIPKEVELLHAREGAEHKDKQEKGGIEKNVIEK